MDTRYSGYTRLCRETAEIRLMGIQTEPETTQLTCTLETVPLAQANPFYALSYVWGDATMSNCIVLNGQCIRTRRNLYDFLRSLTLSISGPVKVWVDFLCINQDDVEERNSQVAMMGQIYSAADSVYAWLGTSTIESNTVYDFVEHSKYLRSKGVPHWEIYNANTNALQAVDDILRRSYWTRLWIIQEIVLAKRLWLFCGSRLISWDELQFALIGHRQESSIGHRGCISSERLKLLLHLKESRETPVKLPLSKLVHKFAAAECQDKRDKIYGLLSLANDESAHLVRIDYRKPLLQVLLENYTSWASEWTLEQDNLDSLSAGVSSYNPETFCHELNVLLVESHLRELYEQINLRREVTAKVTLKGFREDRKTEFMHIARMTSRGECLIPITQVVNASENSALAGPVISHMATMNDSQSFTYTTVTPLPGDRVLHVGPIILLVRTQGREEVIVGRGVEQHCSVRECILEPRTWQAQLLPDSLFQLRTSDDKSAQFTRLSSASKRNQGMDVTLNAAALVEILVMAKQQQKGTTWSPYDFGLQHGIVDMCRPCRVTKNFARSESNKARKCRCIWGANSVQAFSREPRRANTAPE